jgi:hypothetical protein
MSRCADCDVDTTDIDERYMVDFELWERVVGWRECGDLAVYGPGAIHLCVGCLEDRLGRTLTAADFIACSLNTHPAFPRSPRLLERMRKP